MSASLSTCTSTSSSDQARKAKVSCRRQLNILYLLHDTLHHTKFHDASLTDTAAFNQILEAHVTQLVALASAYDPVKYIQHFRKLKDLIDIWSEGGYYSVSHVAALQETIANASSCSDVSIQYLAPTEGSRGTEYAVTGDSRRDAPYIMPSSHGDISTPFYDLPAGNLMPCIVPNSLYPIKPQAMKPVALRAGPADEKLVHVVKSFLHDADTIYGTNRPGNNIETWDIDELGQLILPNDLSGGRSGGEGYYGWSESFCEKMKLRDIEKPIVGSLLQHHQVDLDSRRKRRYSYSDSSRNQSPSRTASRSPSNERRARRMRRRRSDSDSRSRSRSRLQHSSGSRNPRVTLRARSDSLRSRTRSYSPPDVEAPGDCRAGSGKESITATGNGGSLQTSSPTPAFLHQGFFGPGQIPVPPPRPPNYHGPWVSGFQFLSKLFEKKVGEG